MAARHPLFVANGTAGVTTPQDARLALAALLSGPGILNGFNVSGSSSGPNMKYLVAAGAVATQRGTLATDGLYLWSNDGVYTVDTGAPAPTSGSRYDVIYALARNANDGFGDANSDPVIGVVVGTASSTPTVPAAPTGALVLAQALVATNAANAAAGTTITQVAALTGTVPKSILKLSNTTVTYSPPANSDRPITGYSDGVTVRSPDMTYGAGIITVGTAGVYRWDGTVQLPGGVSGVVVLQLLKNGGALPDGQDTKTIGGHTQTVSAGGPVVLAAGDTAQFSLHIYDAALTGVVPRAFSLVRIG